MINKNIARGVSAGALAALLSACGHLPIAKPAFEAMEQKRAGLPADWTEIAQPASDPKAILADYSVFGDPKLIAYIQEALENNRTLRSQVESVRQSEAALRQVRAGLWPRLSAAAGLRKVDGGALNSDFSDDNYSFSVNGGYDVDIMGDLSASIRASIAGLRSTEATYELARRNLAAQVARLYFAVIESQLQLDINQRSLERQRSTFAITKTRMDAGAIAKDEYVLGEAQLSATESSTLRSENTLRTAVRALESALGRFPQNKLKVGDTIANTLPEPPPMPPLGLPELTIRSRPDVVSAELNLVQTFGNLRVTQLTRWPQLDANLGLSLSNGALNTTNDLFDFDNLAFSLGVTLAQTIFDGGAIDARIASAEAGKRRALETYGQTIIDAYGQVVNAIDSFNTLNAQANSLQASFTANTEVLRLGELRYQEGSQNLLDLIQVRERADTSEGAVISNRRARLEQWIALHTALGGDPMRATPLADGSKTASAQYNLEKK
jgi:NodT family efflux transporter outer membrane factor (OMF) lipoprotein